MVRVLLDGVFLLDFLLQHVGLVAVVVASGLMLLWPEWRALMGKDQGVSTLQATQLINQKQAVIFDLRRLQDFELGHLPRARHVPADEIKTRASDIARYKSKPAILVTTAQSGHGLAVKALKELGFTDVFLLKGGMSAWVEANLPIEKT